MKKAILFFLLIFSTLFSFSVNYRTIPLANSVVLKDGFSFNLNNKVKIVNASKSKAMKQNVIFLKNFIKEQTGLELKSAGKTQKTPIIEIALNDSFSTAEAYKISIEGKKVSISAKTEAGVFYGIQTFCKSLTGENKSLLPPAEITDAPRFSYRGAHLDVARHFFSVEYVKRYIDILALHNINTFHWHLTDDQGWRIEIKKYPLLTQKGAVRKETVVGNRKSGIYDNTPYGGFYTQKQIQEIVKYAAERYITIIPEIDMPGHMQAALTAYPELGCTGGPYEVATTWGVFEDVLCAGKENTFTFAENVLTEIMALFPSKYIHIGGDECPKTRWKACKLCNERVHTEQLGTDSLQAFGRLQSYFIQRIEKFINSKGRQIIGWDEILEGGLAPNATVMSWQGVQGGIAAAKAGHNVIMSPYSHLYLNFYQVSETANEPYAIGGLSTMENVYNFNPVPAELNENEAKYVIGAQANLWTEYIANGELAEYMLLPRLAAACEMQWCAINNRNYADFVERLPDLTNIYQKRTYNFAKHVLNTKK